MQTAQEIFPDPFQRLAFLEEQVREDSRYKIPLRNLGSAGWRKRGDSLSSVRVLGFRASWKKTPLEIPVRLEIQDPARKTPNSRISDLLTLRGHFSPEAVHAMAIWIQRNPALHLDSGDPRVRALRPDYDPEAPASRLFQETMDNRDPDCFKIVKWNVRDQYLDLQAGFGEFSSSSPSSPSSPRKQVSSKGEIEIPVPVLLERIRETNAGNPGNPKKSQTPEGVLDLGSLDGAMVFRVSREESPGTPGREMG